MRLALLYPSTAKERTNVVPMEEYIVAHNAELAGALVVANRPSQSALLIEPAFNSQTGRGPLTTSEQAALIERVWPRIREAKSTTPEHTRIDKALILVTASDRPLIRDSNGTIQRGASVEQYTAEMEVLYANAELGPDGEGEAHLPLVSPHPDSIRQFVQECVSAVTSWPHEDADHRPSGTFFERGMDSLTALQLTRVLRRGLRRPGVGLSTVYSHPMVSQLTSAILAAAEDEPQ